MNSDPELDQRSTIIIVVEFRSRQGHAQRRKRDKVDLRAAAACALRVGSWQA